MAIGVSFQNNRRLIYKSAINLKHSVRARANVTTQASRVQTGLTVISI